MMRVVLLASVVGAAAGGCSVVFFVGGIGFLTESNQAQGLPLRATKEKGLQQLTPTGTVLRGWTTQIILRV